MSHPPLTIYLAEPRGFCAGVDRAIQIVEKAIERYGAPVYVRHEIVHNRFVVETLEEKGAVFVEGLSDVPDDRPVVFSAHGVPKLIVKKAKDRNLNFLDATCPLVGKVHRAAEKYYGEGRTIILIGHAGHPEVVGTMGQIPEGAIYLIDKPEDVDKLDAESLGDQLAYVTQTTLSLDDAAKVISRLKERFPDIAGPKRDDICYATTNRQKAVRQIAGLCDAIMVLGAPNSSNSKRLVEVAKSAGCARSILVQRAAEIDWNAFDGIKKLGITAGASAPEILVKEVIEAAKKRFTVTLEEETVTKETVTFALPEALS